MIVLDASALVELLTRGPQAGTIAEALSATGEAIIVPHLIDIEAASAVRSLAAGHRLPVRYANDILTRVAEFPAERFSHSPLLLRIWELRHNFTAYDAAYIALAEAAGATLYTCDGKLASGHKASVRVFDVRLH